MANISIVNSGYESLSELDFSIVYSGNYKEADFLVFNDSVDSFTNVKLKIYDSAGSKSAKKIALGGDGINENVKKSYVFASLDGVVWQEMKGDNGYLQLIPDGKAFEPSDEIPVYIKIEVPNGIVINAQELDVSLEYDTI